MYSVDERSEKIELGGCEYRLLFSTKALNEIVKRFGSLEDMSKKLEKDSIAEQLEAVVWLLTLLINQGIAAANIVDGTTLSAISEDYVSIMTSPADLADYKDAITAAITKGASRKVISLSEKN